MWETAKDSLGVNNFGDAMDPNRSLAERIGQVGIGVGKLYITLSTAGTAAGAMKAGGTMVLEKVGMGAAEKAAVGLEAAAGKAAGRSLARGGVQMEGAASEGLTARGSKTLVSAGEKVAADVRGIPKGQLDAIGEIANKRGVQIGIRPTTPDARAWLESGKAIPKPEGLYNKSINAVDEMLGAPTGRRGLIGSFKPQMPLPQYMPKNPQARFELMERYAERLNEWEKMRPYQSKFKVINGVVHDAASGKPLVSDIDLAGIFQNGKPVPEDVGRRIIAEIRKKCPGVVHGDINSWYAAGSKQQGIMSKIMNSHAQGGQSIVVASPNGVGAGFMK